VTTDHSPLAGPGRRRAAAPGELVGHSCARRAQTRVPAAPLSGTQLPGARGLRRRRLARWANRRAGTHSPGPAISARP